jgi:proline iminopeptidase
MVIAGYSWGGLLALLYAIEHPDHIDRLALVSAAPVWREARADFEARFAARNTAPALQAERKAIRESGLRESDPELHRKRVFELSVAAYFYDPARARDLTPFRVTGRTQEEVWASLGEYDLRPALAPVRVPAIVLHGDSDPIPLYAAETVARILKAPLHVLEHCGHVPYVEALEPFTILLRGFL